MSQIVEIKCPISAAMDNVDVIDVAVKAGDTIAVDDTLITLGNRQSHHGRACRCGRRGERS